MSAETHTTDMNLSELMSARMVLRSFLPASPPISASSSKKVLRLPSCDKRSVTAALHP